jgi:hypothetical protein
VLRVLSAASTLADDEEIESELALIAVRARSTPPEELERLRLEVWLAVTREFTVASAASTLDEEFERE